MNGYIDSLQSKYLMVFIAFVFISFRSLHSGSWGGGLLYEKEKTEALMKGVHCQQWCTFKNSMIEHIGCMIEQLGLLMKKIIGFLSSCGADVGNVGHGQ